MLHAATAITQTTGLTNAITQEVELRTTSIATTNNLELRDQRRVDRPSLLDPDFTNHATNSDVLINATALAKDYRALINLNAFLLAFDDTDMHIDGVADIKAGNIRLECVIVNRFDDVLVAHVVNPSSKHELPALGRQR